LNKPGKRCTDLIEKTASSLSNSVVTLMLLAVQKDNLELNINYAVKWVHSAFERGDRSTETVIKLCILAFPPIWYYFEEGFFLRREQEEREFRRFADQREDERAEDTAERMMNNDNEFKTVFSKLSSSLANPPLLTTSDNIHHVLIAITIILEHGCLIYASQHKPTMKAALDRAYSRYSSSDFHIAVRKQFSAPLIQYSPLQFIEFILEHRL